MTSIRARDFLIVSILAYVYSLVEIEIEGPKQNNIPNSAQNVVGRYTLYHIYMLPYVPIVVSDVVLHFGC